MPMVLYFTLAVCHTICVFSDYYRNVIAVELSSRSKDVVELHTMLYPSWMYVKSLSHFSMKKLLKHQQIYKRKMDVKIDLIPQHPIKIDLIIFCEPKSCDKIPIGCNSFNDLIVLHNNNDLDTFKQLSPMCFFYELDDNYSHKTLTTGYPFITSLYFLIESPFIDIISYYDYILRTDMDSVITPLSLIYIPKSNTINNKTKTKIKLPAKFSKSFMGTDFTDFRLEMLAKQLNLNHSHLHQMQSSWYVQSTRFLQLAQYTVNLTLYLFNNEFTAEKCKEIDDLHYKTKHNDTAQCGWADWHQGVSSLYGQNLAINHVFYNDILEFNKSYGIGVDQWQNIGMDAEPLYSYRIRDILQMHLIESKGYILKQIAEINSLNELKSLCQSKEQNPNNNRFGGIDFMDNKPVSTARHGKEYASRIIMHSLKESCSMFMLMDKDKNDILLYITFVIMFFSYIFVFFLIIRFCNW
eukprot:144245_1